MKLKDYSLEDLEQMTYSEITEIILKESGKKMKIVDIFKKICTALKLSDSDFENKISDFFELVSTDGHFTVLDKGFCDLRTRHAFEVVIEDDEEEAEEDEIIVEEDNIDEEETEEDDDIFYDSSSDEDDLEDEDELSDFALVDEEEAEL